MDNKAPEDMTVDRDEALGVKSLVSYVDSNSHKLKESAVDEKRFKPTVDPADKKEVQLGSGTIIVSTVKDDEDARFKQVERSSMAKEDVKPILLRESVKSINGSESETHPFTDQNSVLEMKDNDILELAAVKVKTSVLDSDGELEEKLELPLKPELDSIKKTLYDKEPLESYAGGDREAATPLRNPSHFLSPRLLSPSFFESGLELEITSSPSPVSESTVVGFNLILDTYIDDELEKKLEKPLKPTLDSIKKVPADKEPLEYSAGGDTLSSVNKEFEPLEIELDLVQVQSDESPKTCSEHDDELIYWCKEDQIMVCPDCFIFGKHRLHTPLRNEEMR